MTLADRLESVQAEANTPKRCKIGQLVDGMNETERAAYEELVQLVGSYTRLSEIMRDEGYKNDKTTLTRHLKGKCICVPE